MRVKEENNGNVTRKCPRCGNTDVSSMEDLHGRVSHDGAEFSADLAAWLTPPQRPARPLSRRHRIGARNSVAFGVVWVLLFSSADLALTGALPTFFVLIASSLIGAGLGYWNWRAESKLAAREDNVLMSAHIERHRAYLRRRRVWDRLFYCAKCGLVIDPITHDTATIYDVHELANSRVLSQDFKGVERRSGMRSLPDGKTQMTRKINGL